MELPRPIHGAVFSIKLSHQASETYFVKNLDSDEFKAMMSNMVGDKTDASAPAPGRNLWVHHYCRRVQFPNTCSVSPARLCWQQ